MASVTSAIGGGLRPLRPKNPGCGPPADRHGAGGFLDDSASGSAAVVLHAGDGAGVPDAQARRKRYV
jgi:hypothetical protein